MSLKKLNHKKTYESNSIGSRPHLDFYIPHLKESIRYDRIASYYSSSSLLVIANGVGEFIKNEGCIRLIINVVIDKKDYDALMNGMKHQEEIVEEILLHDIKNISKEIKKDRWKVLSWMIANGFLNIKVGVVAKNIEHSKLGIFYDNLGNIVSFSGSTNESQSGWIDQSNLINVFDSWTPHIDEYVKSHINTFEKLWNNRGVKTKIYEFPEAAKRGLIRLHKEDQSFNINDSIKKIESESEPESDLEPREVSLKKLRFYQKRALVSWKKSKFNGLFNMATGSGKTFTAIKGISYLRDKTEDNILTIIVCPYNHLIRQWYDELKIENIDSALIYGENKHWKNDIKKIILALENGFVNHSTIITNYVTYSSEYFLETVTNDGYETLLICDEVHNAGSLKSRQGLVNSYTYRLGLSATPERYYDDYGTYIIKDYFNSIEGYTFSYSLENALQAGTLCGYYYNINEVELTDLEFLEYENFNKKIAKYLNKDDDANKERLDHIFIQRSLIITNAQNKYIELYRLLDKLEESSFEHTLIYTSPQQIDEVCQMLASKGIIYSRFTMDEKTDERKDIIEKFESGTYKVLVAMRCLDEGVDIPIVKRAIILASSGNSREYIQRRGRVLRKHEKKDYSEIYDFFVTREISTEIKSIEKKLIKKQLHRISDFSKTSLNKSEILDNLLEIAEKLGIPLPEDIINV